MSAKWEGLDKAVQRFEAVPSHVREAAVEAMELSADELVEQMRRVVPRRFGALADSIGWTWGEVPVGSVIIAKSSGGKNYDTLRITVYAGSKAAYYARFVEFGTRPHATGRGQHPGNSPQPFFYPVYRANKRRIKGRITRSITKAIKRGG